MKPQERNSGGSYVEKRICSKCGSKNENTFLVCMDNCYICGYTSHMKILKHKQLVQILILLKRITFTLSNPEVIKRSLSNVITNMLQVFLVIVYALKDPGDTCLL